MSAKTYPRIGCLTKRDKKHHAPCKVCGKPAAYKVTVETCIFRGDDEVANCCDEHSKDAATILNAISKGQK